MAGGEGGREGRVGEWTEGWVVIMEGALRAEVRVDLWKQREREEWVGLKCPNNLELVSR
jgi:hypothetical protein